jgi:hypothetical protein
MHLWAIVNARLAERARDPPLNPLLPVKFERLRLKSGLTVKDECLQFSITIQGVNKK